jgi:hypothetical protein
MLEIDFHGMTKKEVLQFLTDFDMTDKTTREVKFITGRGTHSKRPHMDYFCEKEWKCPIKRVILDFIIYEKKEGVRMIEYPAYIVWKRKL